jgi:hypothetical protein
VAAVAAAQSQEAVGQDAAFEEGVELVFDELRQVGDGSVFGLGEEGRGVLLHQASVCDCFRRSVDQTSCQEAARHHRRLMAGAESSGPCQEAVTRRDSHRAGQERAHRED